MHLPQRKYEVVWTSAAFQTPQPVASGARYFRRKSAQDHATMCTLFAGGICKFFVREIV